MPRVGAGSRVILLLMLAVELVHVAPEPLPHVDDCNYCFECVLTPPSTTVPLLRRGLLNRSPRRADAANSTHVYSAWAKEPDDAAAAAIDIPGALASAKSVDASLIAPSDHEAKQLKPNCTKCTGCTVTLESMQGVTIAPPGMGGVEFSHASGAANAWLFFGRLAGSRKRYIVKMYCMPYSRAPHGREQPCTRHSREAYAERVRLMLAQVRLNDECGASGLTPRLWLAPVSAVVPDGNFAGYHIRWHGVWLEEAPGAPLFMLTKAAGAEQLLINVLTTRLNRTAVVAQTILDLLTAQCDRHGENVFITASGQVQFIDNDKALGVVSRCGSDSMLLPGNRYHTRLRTGYWGTHPWGVWETYRRQEKNTSFCTGPIDVQVLLDYRCLVPEGRIGRAYPEGLAACMRQLASHPVLDIMEHYGFTTRKPAEILKRRARDMLRLGFEGALVESPPRSSPRLSYQHQPPCCDVTLNPNGYTYRCNECWRPILEAQKDGIKDPATGTKEILLDPGE
ncbi:hypothetical protein HYH03_012691 [Edaphochlamys debaryana]|uniref:Uncharacterized protein n=1 Tax=Edaphochlamys debaryana TaxID=47281 RepID=A0A835XXJ2_9CHLO|nr:hypothetical protein HYH03_012691 [Edaphochlamys debaryana]|eukprot:KAG2488690.1 hypothetical protein HYH03_012691 [Edaphochlamys debaryana]